MNRGAIAALAALLTACNGLRLGPAEAPGGDEAEQREALARRSLAVPDCGGAVDLTDLGTVFVFRIDTASEVSGALPTRQLEVVTRYGVAALCADPEATGATLLTCALARTPLEDPSGDCAALFPPLSLFNELPEQTLSGSVDASEPGSPLRLRGFDERWGLAAGAADLPEVGAGDGPVDPDDVSGLDDADGDGDPGVTLTGDGEVPTVVWAARQTKGSLTFVAGTDPRVLVGISETETQEVVVGGPAARAVAGRARTGRAGDAWLVRADGLARSARADADGDGRVTCLEAAALFGALPAQVPATCRR